jgi:CubicO group peptidase (beta-lactamase class C family)
MSASMLRRSLLLTGLLWTLSPQAAASQPTHPDSLRAEADRIMAPYSGDQPGGVVLVMRDGEVIFQKAYGLANLQHRVPFTLETRTNIGSTSKQFTAYSILRLADQGRLSLDDDIRIHIPELPDLGATITLRHLISHTSGYREFLNALRVGGWRIGDGDFIDREEIITLVQRQPRLQNAPGAEWNYNNTGYSLLSMVVERVTGEAFPAWTRAEVFAPAGMGSTTFRGHRGDVIAGSSQGYVELPDGSYREVMDLAGALGAGGVYTTAGDLAQWIRHLTTQGLLERMTDRFVLTTGDTTNYGFGLMTNTDRGLRVIQHGGADSAHRSQFHYYPELNGALIVLTNRAGPPVAPALGRLFFGDAMGPDPEPAAPPTPPAAAPTLPPLSVFEGAYRSEEFELVYRVRQEGEGLHLSARRGTPMVLARTGPDSFSGPIQVEFERDASGAITGFRVGAARARDMFFDRVE